jgi:hypothetical protein
MIYAVFFELMSDLEAISSNADLQSPDSVYITVSPSWSCLLDGSLPPWSSSGDSSLYFSQLRSPVLPVYPKSHSTFPVNLGIHKLRFVQFRLLIVSTTPDLDSNTHDAVSQSWGPISTTLLSCDSCELSLPPPPSPSQSSDIIDIDLSHRGVYPSTASDPLKANHASTGMCLIDSFPEKPTIDALRSPLNLSQSSSAAIVVIRAVRAFSARSFRNILVRKEWGWFSGLATHWINARSRRRECWKR